jgi:hypothetical protein
MDDLLRHAQEVASLCSQLAYTYSANRKQGFPFDLLYTSVDGRTFTRLESTGNASYKRWAHTEWWNHGFEHLWKALPASASTSEAPRELEDSPAPPSTEDAQNPKGNPAHNTQSTSDVPKTPHTVAKENVVYLTADSDQELLQLHPHETYIIGGICDHNRYKVCLHLLPPSMSLIQLGAESVLRQSNRAWHSYRSFTNRKISGKYPDSQGSDREPGGGDHVEVGGDTGLAGGIGVRGTEAKIQDEQR